MGNWSLPQQFVIPLGDTGVLDREFAERFFFYDHGVKDAIDQILRSYVHTSDSMEDHTGSAYAPILEDMDRYLNAVHDCNAEPHGGFSDMYFFTQMACELLDQHIYGTMNHFFGRDEFRVLEVTDLNPNHFSRYEYLITVKFA